MNYSRNFKIVAGLLCLALAVGGAGINFPSLEMLLQAAAIGVASYFVVTRRTWSFNTLATLSLVLVALTALLPLIQLVPLPPGVWHILPGRELPAELDGVLGSSQWRPWSLDIEATIRSFLRFVPAAVIFAGCLFLPYGDRSRLLRIVVAFALFSAMLGIIQLVTGGWLTPYPSGHSGYPIGLFVNRNHQAAFLLAAMPICAAIGAVEVQRGKPPVPVVVASLSALLVFAMVILGTTSRMGFALLPVGVAGALFVLLRRQAPWRIVVPSVGAVAALALFLVAMGKFTHTLSRFSSMNDVRFSYWSDIQWALEHYGLAGTGVGTFIPVFQTAESLEAVSPAITNHAHNDYLELLLGGGVSAAVLVSIFFILLATALIRASRSHRSGERALVSVGAATSIGILLLFSLVDYPLRMPAVGATFAVLCAVLLPTRGPAAKGRDLAVREDVAKSSDPQFWLRRIPALAVLAILLVIAVQAGVSARAMLDKRYSDAARFAPWSTKAHEQQSTANLFANQPEAALSDALAAVRLSPISAPAIRTIGLVRMAQGSSREGNRLLQIAATLGWRDSITQLWAIDTAERSGEPEKALQRAEALFRQQRFVAPALAELLHAPPQQHMPALLATRLAEQPFWRETVMESSAQLASADVASFGELIAGLNNTKAPASLDEVESLLDALVEREDTADAQRIWGMFHGDNLIANGDFRTIADQDGRVFPRDWDIDPADLSRVAIGRPDFDSGNNAVRLLSNRGPAILSQQLMLQPGVYAFTYRAHVAGGPAAVFRWELRCRNSGEKQLLETAIPPSARWAQIAYTFNVPDRDCPIQRLALRRVRGTDRQQIWLDNVELRRANR